MNYASTNRDPDNDFDMSNKDVVDMVCSKPAASEAARLEDLAPELQKVVLDLYNNPKTASMTIGQYLQLSGIVETTDGDEWTVIFTERGAALVAEYQQRQAQTPADVAKSMDYLAEQNYNLGAKYDNLKLANQDLQSQLATVRAELQAAREREAALEWENNSIKGRYNLLWKAFEKLVKQHSKLGSAASDVYDLEFEADHSPALRYLRRIMKTEQIPFTRK